MKIKSLVFQISGGFVLTTLLIFSIITITYKIGLSRAIESWSVDQDTHLRDIAEKLLTGGEITANDVPENIPLFVYDTQYNILFSNRGGGKKNLEKRTFTDITVDGEILGYYSTSTLHFMDTNANMQFTEAIDRAIFLAIIISSIVITFVSIFLSKKIHKPTKEIVEFIKRIEEGERGITIRTFGAPEMERIATVINDLSLKLQRESEIRNQWARDVAHDLRTPVSALKVQFEAMSSGVLEINQERLKKNLKEVEAMEYLVEDLSDLMRLEEPEVKLYLDNVSMKDLTQQINLHDPVISEKDLSISMDFEIEEIFCDEMLMGRALSNLWNNALRHCNSGGYITLSTKRTSESVVISIKNSGDVIPEYELNKIFDRLYRGETSRHSRGSGLGLSITKRIVNLHGGDIIVRSCSEEGTIFDIMIPI